jgi:predicted Ser/Thr protein kinase
MLCPSCGARNRDGAQVCFGCARHLTALTRGSVIASRFEIMDLLGKGGMGVVYRAKDRLLDEMVAIKVLRHDFVATDEMGQRFRSEIKLARRVSHPNVCRIHEYGQHGGVTYISMALIEGTDLRRLLAVHPHGLPREEAFRVTIQIAEGLQAIHDMGIIHRDLKAPNIIVDESGLVRLMDFGIAKDSEVRTGLTATGEVMGTPEYMSPEQCRGEKLDFRSDVYSLGIVIYEVFTGRLPFRGDSLMATLLKQVQDPPPLEGPEAAAIPAGVVQLLRRALAKEAAQRFSRAFEVVQALREAQPRTTVRAAPEEPAAAPPSLEDRRQHSRLGISVDVVLQRTGANGAVIQEERTVADNIGRRGARVMTAMSEVQVGDLVNLREVGSGFQAQAAVRHVFKPADNIQRLGLEFLDRSAPDRLVPADAETQRGIAAVRPAPTPSAAGASSHERRRDSRLDITVDVILKRLGRDGETLQEERSVADNIGLHGARLMTSMTTLGPGDLVLIEEVGTHFRTRAAVRSSYTGKDNIHRLGVEFLDDVAPDRLVASGETRRRLPQARPARDDRPSPPRPMPAAPAPDALDFDPQRRPEHETVAPAPEPAPARGPEDEENELRQADEVLRVARKHLAHGLYFDAIKCLEGAVELARGSRTNRALRILLARATAKNPKWQRRAEAILQSVIDEDHSSVEARLALGGIYRAAGMWARAEAELRRVLEIHPRHPAASAELKSLRATRTDTGWP